MAILKDFRFGDISCTLKLRLPNVEAGKLDEIRSAISIEIKANKISLNQKDQIVLDQNKLERVLVFSRRVPFKKERYKTNKLAGGLMAFGWFIYDVNYNGKPTIDWI